jgi:F-type H+-transporting ATPase subunit epsilon
MNIFVLTPDREIFSGPIESVKVPGVQGEFQVLNRHAPIVSALDAGKVTIVTGLGEYRYFDKSTNSVQTASGASRRLEYTIGSGFIEVLNNEVSLLVQGLQD